MSLDAAFLLRYRDLKASLAVIRDELACEARRIYEEYSRLHQEILSAYNDGQRCYMETFPPPRSNYWFLQWDEDAGELLYGDTHEGYPNVHIRLPESYLMDPDRDIAMAANLRQIEADYLNGLANAKAAAERREREEFERLSAKFSNA